MTLAVMDRYGLFTYVRAANIDGARNDRDTYTSTSIYLQRGEYFTLGEMLAADGGFEGDGNLLISFKVLNTAAKRLYNLAFTEVRKGIENAFGRVQMWFPILGNKRKYWSYDEETLELAVGAATKLHNWMMRNRGLDYDAVRNPCNFYRNLY